jgi:hypothetical protein
MAGERKDSREMQAAMRAAHLITEAMDLLDAHGVSPNASANLALAQQELRDLISRGSADPV